MKYGTFERFDQAIDVGMLIRSCYRRLKFNKGELTHPYFKRCRCHSVGIHVCGALLLPNFEISATVVEEDIGSDRILSIEHVLANVAVVFDLLHQPVKFDLKRR